MADTQRLNEVVFQLAPTELLEKGPASEDDPLPPVVIDEILRA